MSQLQVKSAATTILSLVVPHLSPRGPPHHTLTFHLDLRRALPSGNMDTEMTSLRGSLRLILIQQCGKKIFAAIRNG